jgi:hypothetical protein
LEIHTDAILGLGARKQAAVGGEVPVPSLAEDEKHSVVGIGMDCQAAILRRCTRVEES